MCPIKVTFDAACSQLRQEEDCLPLLAFSVVAAVTHLECSEVADAVRTPKSRRCCGMAIWRPWSVLARIVTVSVLALCSCAGSVQDKRVEGPTTRPPSHVSCSSGRECAGHEVCVMPSSGGAPRVSPAVGRCWRVPTQCVRNTTCECLVGIRPGLSGASCAPTGVGPLRAVQCTFVDRTLRCTCFACGSRR